MVAADLRTAMTATNLVALIPPLFARDSAPIPLRNGPETRKDDHGSDRPKEHPRHPRAVGAHRKGRQRARHLRQPAPRRACRRRSTAASGPAPRPKSISCAPQCSPHRPWRATWRRPDAATRSKKSRATSPKSPRSCRPTQPMTRTRAGNPTASRRRFVSRTDTPPAHRTLGNPSQSRPLDRGR